VRLVYVEWRDSYGCASTWQALAAPPAAPMICRSVGWLLHDDADCKVIVPHISEDHPTLARQGCGDMTIPTAAIIRLEDLREPAAAVARTKKQHLPAKG
jgi:hypothetical protein